MLEEIDKKKCFHNSHALFGSMLILGIQFENTGAGGSKKMKYTFSVVKQGHFTSEEKMKIITSYNDKSKIGIIIIFL